MKPKTKIVSILVMLVIVAVTAGCLGQSDSKPNWNFEKRAYSLNDPSNSINVSFYAREDNSGWIENNNDFPVTIKEIEVVSYNGEITRWIKVIEAKDKLNVENILSYKYYISTNCSEKAFVIPSKT